MFTGVSISLLWKYLMLSVKTCVCVVLRAVDIYFLWDLCITSRTVFIFQ